MDLLTHEKEYRSEDLIKKLAETPIIVCGCGAIGSNLIDNLIRQGFSYIQTIDFDRVEDHNRGTQLWTRQEVGGLKTEKMKARAYITTGVNILSTPKELTEENIKKYIQAPNMIIDTFDRPESRGLLYNYCKKNNIECLHTGLFQDYAEVIWNDSYIVPKETKGMDVCEYPLARNIILLSVAVTSEVLIKYIDKGIKNSYMITLKDMRINKKDT